MSSICSYYAHNCPDGDKCQKKHLTQKQQFVPIANEQIPNHGGFVVVDYESLCDSLYEQFVMQLTYTASQQGVVFIPGVTPIVYANKQTSSSPQTLPPNFHELSMQLNNMTLNQDAVKEMPELYYARISPSPEQQSTSPSNIKMHIKSKMHKQEFYSFLAKAEQVINPIYDTISK